MKMRLYNDDVIKTSWGFSWRKRLFHDIWQEWMLKSSFELEGKLMFFKYEIAPGSNSVSHEVRNTFVTLSHVIIHITCLSCWFNQSGVSISRTIGIIWTVCNLSHRSFDRMMTRKSFRISFRPISGSRRMSSCSRQWRWNDCWMWTDQRICRIHRIGAELRVNSRSIDGQSKVNPRLFQGQQSLLKKGQNFWLRSYF